MDKETAAAALREIALLLELKGDNPFKSRAYVKAAQAVETCEGDVDAMAREGRLGELPGVGEALQAKLGELFRTNRLEYLEKLRASMPAGLPGLLELPGLGPRKLRALHEGLGIDSIESLEKACRDDRVAALAGFGAATQARLLEAIARQRQCAGLHRFGDVFALAGELREALRSHPDVSQVEVAGEFRRSCEVVGGLVLVAAAREAAPVLDFFAAETGGTPVERGPGVVRISLPDGPSCELHVVPNPDFAHRLLWLTGNPAHIAALQSRARARGIDLGPDGIRPATAPHPTEHDIYRALGLPFVTPELREGIDEVDAASTGPLPRLVEWTDLRGAFHCHTTASDGRDSLETMAETARALGLEYLGIADHSKSSAQARGLDEGRLLAQIAEIRRLNASWDDFRLLAGSEVDILKDGSLDFDDAVLAQLDYVVASVHSHFNLDESAMTRRFIRAAEHPRVTMLGHLSGRLLLERPGYALDVNRIIDACAASGTWIELNANPRRLDMDWRCWRRARDKGVLCVINPDAHSRAQIGYLRFGAAVARKGWLRSQDVANARPWPKMQELLRAKHAHRNVRR